MNACVQRRSVVFVMSRAAMPNSLKFGAYNYYSYALVSYPEGSKRPTTLHSAHDRRFHDYSGKVHVGSTERSAGYSESRRLREIAPQFEARLNRECYNDAAPEAKCA